MKSYLLFSTSSSPVGTQQSTFYGMYRKQQGHAFELWGQNAVCICLLSLTLVTVLLFTLCLFSLPPPFSWVGTPVPHTCTCSQYMLAVPEKKGERKGVKSCPDKETGRLQYKAHYNMRHRHWHYIKFRLYWRELTCPQNMFSKTWGNTKLLNSYLFSKATFYSM